MCRFILQVNVGTDLFMKLFSISQIGLELERHSNEMRKGTAHNFKVFAVFRFRSVIYYVTSEDQSR